MAVSPRGCSSVSATPDAFELEIKRRQQLGSRAAASVLQLRVTLAEFVAEDWWPRHAIPNPPRREPSTAAWRRQETTEDHVWQ